MSAFLSGMGIGAGLIIAIGAQNAFVLAQGLRKHHHISVALVCALCDTVFITIGVAGLGAIVSENPLWSTIMAWGGAAFLFWYGLCSFRALFSDHSLKHEKAKNRGFKEVLMITLALTLLNPHVYIDTIVLLGGIAAQYSDDQRPFFGMGAILSSFLWFATISLGAAWLSPYLARPITWKILDLLTGVVMWVVAISLLVNLYG